MIGAVLGLPFGWPIVSARTLAPIKNCGSRPTMVRVNLDWQDPNGYSITAAEKQGSHMLTSITESNGYIILPPKAEVAAGETQTIYCYDSKREVLAVSVAE